MHIPSIAKAALLSVGLAIWGGSAGAAPPPPPPPPPPPVLAPVPDINSDEFRRQLADHIAAARRIARASNPAVTQRFNVGWEMHGGYYLTTPEDEWVTPDFDNDEIVQQFNIQAEPLWRLYRVGTPIPHLGQRLVCDCTGIEWSLYSQRRFIVQSAHLIWLR